LIDTRDRAPSHDGGSMWFMLAIGLWLYGRLGWTIREKWRILDGKVETGLMSDSELQGGSPRLCRLRTDHLAPVNKIELCTGTYEIYVVPQT
jgi:hypothetical protein